MFKKILVYIKLILIFSFPSSFAQEAQKASASNQTSTNQEAAQSASATSAIKQGKVSKKFKIAMVLWSGATKIEDGFKEYMKQNNIDVEYTTYDCKADKVRCHNFIKDIRDNKTDLIYTWGTPAALAIGGTIDAPNKDEYVWDIPIVSAIVASPVFSKLIYDFDKTGRNITGVNHLPSMESQLNTMLKYKSFNKIAIFHLPIPNEAFVKMSIDKIKEECAKKNIELVDVTYNHITKDNRVDPTHLDATFKQVKESGVDMVYLPSSNYLSIDSQSICDAATRNKLLTFVATELMINKGNPLFGLISRYINIGRFAAEKAKQILVDGKKPEELSYETFKKFNLFINVPPMRDLNIYPPLNMVEEAQFVNVDKKD